MRVAALYDIHGNLPALRAVLEEARRAGADHVVVGGDVVPGPMPRQCLEHLLNLDLPVSFIHGNCELAVLAQMAAPDAASATYWGTSSGRPLQGADRDSMRWSAQQLGPEYGAVLERWPKTLRLDIDGIGATLFCHGTPRSETEIFTRLTAEDRLRPLFDPLGVALVVCGHSHMQFDRRVGGTRVVNAGSVGMPFGAPGAYWALLGPDVELRRAAYDHAAFAARVRQIPYPAAAQDAEALLHPVSEQQILEHFGPAELMLSRENAPRH